MKAREFLKIHFPHILKLAQKLGAVGQLLFDTGRVYERYVYTLETFEDGAGI